MKKSMEFTSSRTQTRQFGNLARHSLGGKLETLGHSRGTVGAQSGHKITWGTVGAQSRQSQLGHSWGIVEAQLGHNLRKDRES